MRISHSLSLLRIIVIILSLVPVTLSNSSAIAAPIIADLSIRSVDIDHDFVGLDILLFGARNDAGNIIVALRGPKKNYIVRKKQQVAGIWANRKSVIFQDVTSFYAIAGSKSLSEINNERLLTTLEVGMKNLPIKSNIPDTKEFKTALINYKEIEGLYTQKIEHVSFWGETLFRTILKFPKNIDEGLYTAEVYLFSDGVLSAMQSTPISVRKIGFSAFIFDTAHKYSLVYGILCVILAILAGWTASAIFGRR